MCCCECCSVTQRKIWVFGLGTIFAMIGTVLLIIWPDLALKIMHNKLVIRDGSDAYENWIEAPIPIYLEFHMFNWTNPDEIRKPNVKPHFVEMGPYVFLEKHFKQNLTWFKNDSVSYFEKRTWFFDEKRSNGSLDDLLTTAHVISATVADEMRHKNKIMKKMINFMLNHEGGHLYTKKTIREWIFDGYQDQLIDFLRIFNTSKINMPYTRFGWMVDRNNSAEYDGLFTMKTGADDLTQVGTLTHWHGKPNSGFYESPCDTINGTTGDIFPPHLNRQNELTIFAPDACRYLNLSPDGVKEMHGIEAVRWVGTEETLDAGDNYPSQKCFCNPKFGECPKAGVVDCKKCRDMAPIYTSFPHFHLADKSYLDAVSGLKPDPEKHTFSLAVQPDLGIPLSVNARLQINMKMEGDNDFDIYRGVPKFLMPMLWFEQKAELDNKLASRAKLALNLESYGRYFGIGLISLGVLFYIVGVILTLTKRWKRAPHQDDEDLLTPN